MRSSETGAKVCYSFQERNERQAMVRCFIWRNDDRSVIGRDIHFRVSPFGLSHFLRYLPSLRCFTL